MKKIAYIIKKKFGLVVVADVPIIKGLGNNAEEGHLLAPYFEHGVVEGEDEFLALLQGSVIAILWGHSVGQYKCP